MMSAGASLPGPHGVRAAAAVGVENCRVWNLNPVSQGRSDLEVHVLVSSQTMATSRTAVRKLAGVYAVKVVDAEKFGELQEVAPKAEVGMCV
jgi:hypothetical protein